MKQQTITGFEVAVSNAPLCACCYQPFERNRPNKIYCSKECRKAAWYEANRDQVLLQQREKRAVQRAERVTNLDLTQRTPRRRRNSSETIDDLMSIIQLQQQQIAQLLSMAGQQPPPARQRVEAAEDVQISMTKATGGDSNVVENFTRALSGLTGTNFANETKAKEGAIKKLDVPEFAPPTFDDDIEL